MSDFDLVAHGNIVEADGIVENGWIGVRDGKVAARGQGKPPTARDTAGNVPGLLQRQKT